MTGPWIALTPKLKELAADLAAMQAKNYTERQLHGRTRKEAQEDTRQGLIAEITENQADLRTWWEHWQQSQADRDDGGVDTADGKNVKVVLPWQQYVFARDKRAKEYVVYELDERNNRIRYRGMFNRSDIEDIELSDKTIPGVKVGNLR